MAKQKTISSIDIGSTKITTLISQVSEDEVGLEKKISVIGVSSVVSKGIKKAQIVNIEEAVEATISSIEAAERMAGYHLDRAYISVGGANIISQNSHGVVAVSDPDGEISDSDVERVIEAASAISLPSSREIVHIVPREFSVDGETGIKDPVGMSGVRLEVDTHIISASTSSLKNIRKAINEMGVGIEELVFSGFASAQSVLTPTEKELGCVVVDIGGGTTSVASYIDGSLTYSGVIPIGAKNVTNDVAIGLRVSLEDAEKIKIFLSGEVEEKKNGRNVDEIDLKNQGIEGVKKISRRTLVNGIIRPRLNEIFTIVKLDLDRAGLSAKVPSGVIVTGGGAQTVGVVESAKRTLTLPVRVGKPKGVTGLIDDITTSDYSASVGLLHYGAANVEGEPLTKIGEKFKLPVKGFAGKIIESLKDLLP